MGTASRRRPACLSPSSVADLSTAAHEHRYPCSPDVDDADDDFEFTPLLPGRRRGSVTWCPRTACRGSAAQAEVTHPPPQRAARRAQQQAAAKAAPARRVRWHEMAFGSVRVPAAMDMGEIRRRLQAAPRRTDEPAAGWAPWRLIRSLSCKGIEAVAVAAVSAPVRLAYVQQRAAPAGW